MNRKQTTKMLSKLTEKYINPNHDTRIYYAKEVSFDYGTKNDVRVDYMQFKPVNNTVSGIEHGDVLCFEIKSCVEDFHSGNGLNFIGDYNYLVTTREIYEQIKTELPMHIGVLVPDDTDLKSVRRAKRMNRKYPLPMMLLMMFRSANRDNIHKNEEDC